MIRRRPHPWRHPWRHPLWRAWRSAWCRAAVALAVVLVAGLVAQATAISYTVQVIAVSDQDTAISISRDLLRDGYPAYVVRSTGAPGDVFRVRVGAFANRAAALRYADSMPEVGGSKPVPALAEAIPEGIMPLAPRLVWQAEWAGEDARVLPWPGGVALRLQPGDPLRQARYVVVQDGVVREIDAWSLLPLAVVPELVTEPEIDVPMVDLTLPPEPEPEPEPEPVADDPPSESVASEADRPEAEPEPEAEDVMSRLGARLADPEAMAPEAGLLLLRDRWLWPASWEEDEQDVRSAFRTSMVALVARAVELPHERVDALAYFPGGEPPPALVVLDLSDASGRDAGRVVAIGDMASDVRPYGPSRLVPESVDWSLPAWPETRLEPEPVAQDARFGGDEWVVRSDGDFIRVELPDGATWRSGVGAPLWSDGAHVVAWDGQHLLIYDFVRR